MAYVYPVVISKSEWRRLKKAGGPVVDPVQQPEGVSLEYLQELDTKSRELMKNWPDSIYGVVAKLDQEKNEKLRKEQALIDEYRHGKKIDKSDVMKNAKQMIFHNSCYGKQLISALQQSKVIEEREFQIEFKKELKSKDLAREIELQHKNTLEEVGKYDVENKRQSQERYKLNTVYNRDVHEEKLKKMAEERQKEIEGDLEDAKRMEHLLHLERNIKNTCLDEEGVKAYEASKLEKRERLKKTEQKEEALAKAWNNYKDRVHCRTKLIKKEIYKDKGENESFKKHYDLVEELNQKQDDKYNRIVNIGIERLEQEIIKQDEIDEKKKQAKHRHLIVDSKCARLIGEIVKESRATDQSVCDKQNLMMNTHNTRKVFGLKNPISKDPDEKSFQSRSTKLQDELQQRSKEPTPWTGMAGTHAYFAQQADAILSECRHKRMARKVVDQYRKLNCLDTNSLPISNYEYYKMYSPDK